jgi:nickel superoxide dismutase
MQTRKKVFMALSTVLISLVLSSALYPHCQIPCGIYDDPARLKMIAEHITTIEKSMTEINALSAAPGPNANLLVRWVK